MSQLPVQPAWRLADCPEQQRWLVEGLWSEEAVGIIGGEPKCGKSFLALDLAVAVATGIPCLRRFAVSRPGRVLLYPAEDALHIVRRRLEGICAAAGVALSELDIQVITAPSLRLDLEADRMRLEETVAQLKPRLLVLDPFVRLHRIDENVSGDVAPLLAFLRELQRRHAIAVVLVHHAKKGAGAIRAGQALRGSSEFHAWGDSNLYLRRDSNDRIVLTVEHRAAAAMPGITLELTQRDNAPIRPSCRTNFRRSAHHRGPRRPRAATAVRRTADILPRPHHHSLRAPRRHDRCRPCRQISRRLQPLQSLTSARDRHFCNPPRQSPQSNRHGDCAAQLPTPTSHALYSRPEAEAGSASISVTGRPSKSEILLISTGGGSWSPCAGV
jgi:hypothetical protein